MSATIIFAGLLIIFGHAFKVLFDKTRVPDVVPMVLLGLLAGPCCGYLTPEKFGIMGELMGTLALAIILFYSGLEINLETVNRYLLRSTNLAGANFMLAMFAVAMFAKLFLGMPLLDALGIGAILGGTSFAIVIPMTGAMKISASTKTVLLLESTFTDVLCIVVSLGIFQMMRMAEMTPGVIMGGIMASFVMSACIGAVVAYFWATVLQRVRRLDNDMFLTPAVIVTVFGFAEFLGYSGAISSLAFGMVSGNINKISQQPFLDGFRRRFPAVNTQEFNSRELALFSELVFVLKIFFFFYIGLSIKFSSLTMTLAGIGMVAALFIMRIIASKLFLGGIPAQDRLAASIMIPKGLVSVVLLSVAARAGYGNLDAVKELVYSIILFSIVGSAVLAFMYEKGWLADMAGRIFKDTETFEPEKKEAE